MSVTTNEQSATDTLVTPFASLSAYHAAAEDAGRQSPVLESPFASLLAQSPDPESEEVAGFVESLHDEDFADALERLVDEAAARHLVDQGAWSGPVSEAESYAALESWIEPLAVAAEKAMDELAEALEAAHPDSLSSAELEELLDGLGEPAPLGQESFDQFFEGFWNKAKKLAGKALSAVGKIVPVGIVLKRLAAMVRPWIKQILGTAIGKLPESVRPLARTLAAKLGVGEAEQQADGVTSLADDFDVEIAALLFAPEAVEQPGETFWEAAQETRDPVGELEAGRARLAEQLTELPPDASPEAEIQQFLPLVQAARPLIKLGISIIGRDKLVRHLAKGASALIGPLIGAESARRIAPPLIDVGLRAFGFEGPEGQETLTGEALASTVEATVLRTLELLPPEAFEDELQVDAALQTAFAEAAAAYLPDQLLRADLAERETAGEGGVWVLMPRATRPRYRFRKYTRVYAVPVTRQLARALRWSDGGTLEAELLDRGVDRWPVQAEVHLYEALPGTHFGHLTQDETLPTDERPDSSEYQPLTPEVAGQLLGEPALGRTPPAGATTPGRARPAPGRRYFRIRTTGLPRAGTARRRRRRLLVGLNLPKGRLTVALRLSERQAQQLLTRLQPAAKGTRRDLPTVLSALRAQYTPQLPTVLVKRLIRHAVVADAAVAGQAADRITATVTAALSTFLTERPTQLTTAVQDPANGVTLTVTFSGVTRSGLLGALPRGEVTVAPGWRSRV